MLSIVGDISCQDALKRAAARAGPADQATFALFQQVFACRQLISIGK